MSVTLDPKTQALVDHYRTGVDKNCLVCDQELHGRWTDYNGEIRCWTCGSTYQILGCHLRDEFLEKVGLKKENVAKRYCEVFQLVPLLRDYWQETGRKIPFGCYLGRTEIPKDDYLAFYGWLKLKASKYEQEYADEFSWDAIKNDPQL